MQDFLNRAFRLRAGETGIVLVLGLVLFGNSVAQQISEIAAISNFLTEGGVNQILIVWAIDSVLILSTTSLQSLFIDRFNRISLVRGLIFTFALLFVVVQLMFTFPIPRGINYAFLFLLGEQQWLFFPIVFWILANDVLDMAQAKRLFPLIAGWGFAGKLLGIGISAISPGLLSRLNIPAYQLLMVNVLIYLVAYVIMMFGLRGAKVRQTVQAHESLRETLSEGWGFVREVPAFRYLTISIVALVLCETVLEFRFLVVSNGVYSDPASYQTFYSLYRLGIVLASLLVQGLLTSRLIEKLGLKQTFLILPISALGGALWMLAAPGIVSAVGGVIWQKLPQYTVDESSRKSFEALVPEERRGRVSIFLDSYVWAAGAIIGCTTAGVIVFLGTRLSLPDYFFIYLGAAALAALLAIWAIWRMRAVYDSSLLSWRLKRRQRGASVLDKLEF